MKNRSLAVLAVLLIAGALMAVVVAVEEMSSYTHGTKAPLCPSMEWNGPPSQVPSNASTPPPPPKTVCI